MCLLPIRAYIPRQRNVFVCVSAHILFLIFLCLSPSFLPCSLIKLLSSHVLSIAGLHSTQSLALLHPTRSTGSVLLILYKTLLPASWAQFALFQLGSVVCNLKESPCTACTCCVPTVSPYNFFSAPSAHSICLCKVTKDSAHYRCRCLSLWMRKQHFFSCN